jgi:beta-glucanase (GH16 family)
MSKMALTVLVFFAVLFCGVIGLPQGMNPVVWFAGNYTYDQLDNSQGCWMPQNSFVPGDGYLHLRTSNQGVTCYQWAGSNLAPAGPTAALPFSTALVYTGSYDFTYGVVVVRAQYSGLGTWPAIWLINSACQPYYLLQIPGPAESIWQQGTEIDIAEYKPGISGTGYMYENARHQMTWDLITVNPMNPDPTQGFNVYGLVWTASSITWYLNGVQQEAASLSYSLPMFLNLGMTGVNNAASGTLNPANLPEDMLVDYARICPPGTSITGCTAAIAQGTGCTSTSGNCFDDEFNTPSTNPWGVVQGGSASGGGVQ